MTKDLQSKILLAKVQAMISELEDRVGPSPGYSELPLFDLSLDELERVRKDLHEILYAPPPRMRS